MNENSLCYISLCYRMSSINYYVVDHNRRISFLTPTLLPYRGTCIRIRTYTDIIIYKVSYGCKKSIKIEEKATQSFVVSRRTSDWVGPYSSEGIGGVVSWLCIENMEMRGIFLETKKSENFLNFWGGEIFFLSFDLLENHRCFLSEKNVFLFEKMRILGHPVCALQVTLRFIKLNAPACLVRMANVPSFTT